jgi:NADH:ubiquinone oxidoreductase subunit 5 (subunit L)/multisubunit Na+/H+ antiporter MnhA subunit
MGCCGTAASVYWWITAGNFKVDVGYFFDPLTAVMLCVVCGIGFFITVYAAGYMKGEAGYFRFFAYLGLFIFAMTNLVMGSNFIMLYLGWEGVGLCSYLLIGYYYEKPSAVAAAKKAFLVNRIGDFGFGLGIMMIFWAFRVGPLLFRSGQRDYRRAGHGPPSATAQPDLGDEVDSVPADAGRVRQIGAVSPVRLASRTRWKARRRFRR